MNKLKVGVVGCGYISGAYFKGGYRFKNYELVAMADVMPEKARAKVEEIKGKEAEWGVRMERLPVAQEVDELIANPEVELVVNLTVPTAHGKVALAALAAGKHTYSEKPFAVTREEGLRIMALAKEKGLRVGCAPDTFLGGGHQMCRKLVDEGWIGRPVAAAAFLTCGGVESWHTDPEFFYKPGGGPMFDMGPYYLTALIHMLGPVKRVSGMAGISIKERMITSLPKYGQMIKVETPTHITGALEFASGVIATVVMSFDIHWSGLPRIEVYGTRGTVSTPDPNGFGDAVGSGAKELPRYRAAGAEAWSEIPSIYGYMDNSRGIGVADMASAIATGRAHRASGEMANHVVDVMQGFLDAAASGRTVEMTTTCERPAALPLGLRDGEID